MRRLAVAYGVEIVEVRDADSLLAWCRRHDIGLSVAILQALLGRPVTPEPRHRLRLLLRRTPV
jgi:hypothetical protein